MAEHFAVDGIVPTLLGLRTIAERFGFVVVEDKIERCYRALYNDRMLANLQTVELWGSDKVAAKVHIGNWMLRQSEAIHG